MGPKKIPQNPDQGALLSAVPVNSGHPDANMQTHSVKLEEVPGGVFQEKPAEDAPPSQEEIAFMQGVHKAVMRDKHSREQAGRHTPLAAAREGSYSGVRPGDVLPGFGVVTRRNLTRAEEHAQRLDQKRGPQTGRLF